MVAIAQSACIAVSLSLQETKAEGAALRPELQKRKLAQHYIEHNVNISIVEVFMGFSRPTDRLLFLVYADPLAAEAAVEIGCRLRGEYGLRGLSILPRHVHSTLWHVCDDFSPPSPDLIAALTTCANRVSMPAFRVSFDRVESFVGGALVLRGEDGVIGLELLYENLAAALCLKHSRSFVPHMTLLRDKYRLLPSMPVEPIEWTVTEFALVHSLLGKTTHRVLARFPLVSPPPSDRGK